LRHYKLSFQKLKAAIYQPHHRSCVSKFFSSKLENFRALFEDRVRSIFFGTFTESDKTSLNACVWRTIANSRKNWIYWRGHIWCV